MKYIKPIIKAIILIILCYLFIMFLGNWLESISLRTYREMLKGSYVTEQILKGKKGKIIEILRKEKYENIK